MEKYEQLMSSEEFDSTIYEESVNVRKSNRSGMRKSANRARLNDRVGRQPVKANEAPVNKNNRGVSNKSNVAKSKLTINVTNDNTAEMNDVKNNKRKPSKNNLKVMFLGGIGEVGKNMTVFEYGNDILIIDSGVMFPDDSMLGIDLVVPDITYLVENKDKIRGMVITHGHEDHIGGLPYVLNEIKTPIYASSFTCGLIQKKMEEFRKIQYKTNVVKPRQKVKIGCFEVEFIGVNHSIAGSFGLAIKTPVGIVMHSGDFKVDLTPVHGERIDFHRFAEYGNKGVLLYMADSTNAEREGYSMSERVVSNTFEDLFDEHSEERIIIATFASNVHRLQEIMNIAERHGRKIAFTGRSMVNVTDVATKVGEMKVNKSNIVDIDKLNKFQDKEICIISTGSQGEPMSALVRMASGEFKGLEIGDNDCIIFSSSPIPGNEKMVNNVINKLITLGADVIYNQLEQVHASGHACKEELKTMFALVKPKYFIPVHGEQKHLMAHATIAESMGVDRHNILTPQLGMRVEIGERTFKSSGFVPFGSRLIDGAGVGEMESNVLKERKQLSEDGLCVVIVNINSSLGKFASRPEIVSRGFTYMGEAQSWLEEAKNVIIDSAEDVDLKARDYVTLKQNIRKHLTTYLNKKLKRKPMIIPIIVESN